MTKYSHEENVVAAAEHSKCKLMSILNNHFIHMFYLDF